MCGKNSCITIRNIVKAGGVQKPIRYIWPAEFSQIDSVISDGSIPVLR